MKPQPTSRRHPRPTPALPVRTPIVHVDPELVHKSRVQRTGAWMTAAVGVAAGSALVLLAPDSGGQQTSEEHTLNGWTFAAVLCFAVAGWAVTKAATGRVIHRIVQAGGWQLSACTAQFIGSGKRRMQTIRLAATGAAYGPSIPAMSPGSRFPDTVEWAGTPTGEIAVRVPGTSQVYLYRALGLAESSELR